MRRFTSILFLGLFSFAASAQTVITSVGSTLRNGSITVEYSVGEISITMLSTNQNQVTQGLLQPLLSVKECKLLDLIPSAFTPNGDAKNDCFGLANWPSASGFELSIYNRWGQLVFKTTKPTDCWNGQFNGVVQPAGVYVYMVKATTASCGAVVRKGTVALIR